MSLFLWTIALLWIPTTEEADPSKGLERLRGTWEWIRGEEVGHKITPEDAKNEGVRFVFRGDSLVIREKSKIVDDLTVTLDPGGRKGSIDFKHNSGKYKGKTCHAIYSLDGDQLRICTASKLRADSPEERPTIFSTAKKQEKESDRPGKLLFILRREGQKR